MAKRRVQILKLTAAFALAVLAAGCFPSRPMQLRPLDLSQGLPPRPGRLLAGAHTLLLVQWVETRTDYQTQQPAIAMSFWVSPARVIATGQARLRVHIAGVADVELEAPARIAEDGEGARVEVQWQPAPARFDALDVEIRGLCVPAGCDDMRLQLPIACRDSPSICWPSAEERRWQTR
jgi:hypothetical protein